MPAITLYGRRWHFSSDVIPLPAALGAAYSLTWALLLVLLPAAGGDWPHHCESHEGVQYVVLFAAMFASFVALLAVELLLCWHGSKGERGAGRQQAL